VRLNIVHKFTLLSALATIVITVGMGFLVSQIVTAAMLRNEGQITASTLRTVTSVDLRPEDFRKAATGRDWTIFGYIWEHLQLIPDAYKMWVYDAEGRVVWADSRNVGWDQREATNSLRRALAGAPAVDLGRADEVYEFRSGLAEGEAKLEIYVPLLADDDKSMYGVVEVWKRPESFLARRRQLVRTVWGAGCIGGLVLFLFLHGFFRRALKEQDRLREVEKRLDNVELELQVAGGIQRKLMPKALPDVPGYSLAAWHETAHEVGGDYYDAFVTGTGSLVLVVADSEGQGMPGALTAARVRHRVRAEPEPEGGAAAVIGLLDRMLQEQTEAEAHVSAFFARLGPRTGELRCCNAGSCSALLSRDGTVSQLAKDGTPAGANGDGPRDEEVLAMRPGDCLLLCTDGIVEMRSPAGERFGEGRLRALLLKRSANAGAGEVMDALRRELDGFAGGQAPTDDITALCLVALADADGGDGQ
jgi:serine phosphatase RsbU (regulator of sigma subunit)